MVGVGTLIDTGVQTLNHAQVIYWPVLVGHHIIKKHNIINIICVVQLKIKKRWHATCACVSSSQGLQFHIQVVQDD